MQNKELNLTTDKLIII